MIRIEARNPRFSGVRAGVAFRDGVAEVEHLTGAQRQAMRKFRMIIHEGEGDAPNDIGELTVRELRDLAAERGMTLPPSIKKADLVQLLSAS